MCRLLFGPELLQGRRAESIGPPQGFHAVSLMAYVSTCMCRLLDKRLSRWEDALDTFQQLHNQEPDNVLYLWQVQSSHTLLFMGSI